jgi:hypothetical protein
VRDHGRAGAVPDDRGHGRGDVGVDRADVGAQQRVDQRALALLELADDGDRNIATGEAGAGLVEPGHQVGAAGLHGQPAHAVDVEDGAGQLGASPRPPEVDVVASARHR